MPGDEGVPRRKNSFVTVMGHGAVGSLPIITGIFGLTMVGTAILLFAGSCVRKSEGVPGLAVTPPAVFPGGRVCIWLLCSQDKGGVVPC